MPHIYVYASAVFQLDGRFGRVMEDLTLALPRIVAEELRTHEPEGRLKSTDVAKPMFWPEPMTVDAATPHLELIITASQTPGRLAKCVAARERIQYRIWKEICRLTSQDDLRQIEALPFRMGVGIRLPQGSYAEFCLPANRESIPA